jgi:hypothetical protein
MRFAIGLSQMSASPSRRLLRQAACPNEAGFVRSNATVIILMPQVSLLQSQINEHPFMIVPASQA